MNNSNQIIIATAVVGGLLIGAPDAMAQGTYSGAGATVATSNGVTAVTVSAGATTNVPVTVSTAAATVVTVPAGASATVPVTSSNGLILTATAPAGSTVTVGTNGSITVGGGATLPVPAGSTVTAPLGTTAGSTVTVGTGSTIASVTTNGGTVAVTNTTVASGATVATGTPTTPGTITVSGSTGLTISSGATLSGSGQIVGTGGAPVQIAGILKPGNSPGILTVQDAQIQIGSTGKLGIDIDGETAGNGPGKYSQVVGTGTTSFAPGGTLKPNLAGDVIYTLPGEGTSGYGRDTKPAVGASYTIVDIKGTGNTGTTQFAGLEVTPATAAALRTNTKFDVVYNEKSIVLYVTPSKYQNLTSSGVSLSTNQTNSATALQSVRDINKPLGVERISNTDLKSLFDNLAPRTAGDLQSIYDQISGASIASLGTQSVRTANVVTDAFTARASHERTLAQTGIAKTASLGLAGGDVDGANRGDRGWSAWVQPLGQIGSVDSDGNGPGYSHSTIGALAGIEGRVRNAVFGFGYGYARDTLDFDNFSNKTDVDNHILSAYGEYAANNLFVNGTLGYTWKNVDEKRNINFGSYSKTATGKTDGSNFNVAGTVGYTFTPQVFIVEPSIGLRYNAFSLDGFTETGAGSLNLRVGKQDYDSLQSLLSVRIARPFTTDSGMKVVPEVRVGWQHEILDNRSTITSAFTTGGSSFSSTGSQVGDDAAVLGLGLRAQVTGTLDVFANYDARIGSKQIENGLTAGMKYKF